MALTAKGLFNLVTLLAVLALAGALLRHLAWGFSWSASIRDATIWLVGSIVLSWIIYAAAPALFRRIFK
jgi:hypothetical protein